MIPLRPCDIVIVRGRGWLSRAIRKLTRSPGEPPTRASHVAIATGQSSMLPGSLVIEALSRGVVHRALPDHYAMTVYRPRALTTEDEIAIMGRAWSFVGRPYGWGKVALHALDGLLGGIYLFRRLAFVSGWPVCSYVVAAAYAAAGYTFGVEVREATPDCIDDFCRAHPDKYRKVYP